MSFEEDVRRRRQRDAAGMQKCRAARCGAAPCVRGGKGKGEKKRKEVRWEMGDGRWERGGGTKRGAQSAL